MDEIPWNKLCADLIDLYNILRKRKESLIPKAVTRINPIIGWSKVTKYDDKKAMAIAYLVETKWLSRYPCPSESTYDRGSDFLGHDFKNALIKEYYGIIAELKTAGNLQANSIIKIIHHLIAK